MKYLLIIKFGANKKFLLIFFCKKFKIFNIEDLQILFVTKCRPLQQHIINFLKHERTCFLTMLCHPL